MSLRFPLFASKIWTNVSSLADAISLPSGDHVTEFTLARWPVKIRTLWLLTVVRLAGGTSFDETVGGTDFASLRETAYQPPAPPAIASPTRPNAKARRVIVLLFPRRGASDLSSNAGCGVTGGGNGTGVIGLRNSAAVGTCDDAAGIGCIDMAAGDDTGTGVVGGLTGWGTTSAGDDIL